MTAKFGKFEFEMENDPFEKRSNEMEKRIKEHLDKVFSEQNMLVVFGRPVIKKDGFYTICGKNNDVEVDIEGLLEYITDKVIYENMPLF